MKVNKNQNLPENIPPIYYTFETIREYSYVDIAMYYFYDFFDWWYIKMPILLFKFATRFLSVANDQLSFSLLLRTFLVPWHRDNKLVGYFMGIMMRIIFLPISFLLLLLLSLASLVVIIIWILLPILSIIMLFLSPALG